MWTIDGPSRCDLEDALRANGGRGADGSTSCVISAQYSPTNFMVAGPTGLLELAIDRLRRTLAAQPNSVQMSARRLKEVNYAYHSPIHRLSWAGGRSPPAGELRAQLPRPDGPWYFSCVGGKRVASQTDLSHIEDWRLILEQPVEFSGAMDAMILTAAPCILLDLSLKADLRHYYTTYCDGREASATSPTTPEMIPTLRLGGAGDADMRFAAAQLLTRGVCSDDGILAEYVRRG
eukprot:SAG31_NODE_2609_length_5382_cov_6.846678_4_plen_234_part_00